MKKIIAILTVLVMVIALVACEDKPKTGPESDTVTEAQEEIILPLEDIIEPFNYYAYQIMDYDEDIIEEISAKIRPQGEILAVVYIIGNMAEDGSFEWVYCYEFELDSDARWYEGDRTAYAAGIDNGRCRRFGNIVVYGNAPGIDELGK